MTEHSEETGELALRLGYVPGVTPAKWVRIWRERVSVPLELVALESARAAEELSAGHCDIAIMRPPVDRERLHAIELYAERAVVVVPRDHLLAALADGEEVTDADLADEIVLAPVDDVLDWPSPPPGRPARERPPTTKAAIEWVAAGVGVVIVPQSLARLHHRRDVTYRPLAGAPTAPVVLAWVAGRAEQETGSADDVAAPRPTLADLIEEFIGIVRGRTVNSSRGSLRDRGPGGSGASGQAGKGQAASRRAGKGSGAPGQAGRGSGGSRQRSSRGGKPRPRGSGRDRGTRR